MPTRIVHLVVKFDTDRPEADRAGIAGDCMDRVEDALVSFYGGHRGCWHYFNKINGEGTHSLSIEGASTLPNATEDVKPQWGAIEVFDDVETRAGAGQPRLSGKVIGIDGQHVSIQTSTRVAVRTISNVRRTR